MAKVNNYESMFILNANLSKDETDKLIEKFQTLLTSKQAEVAKVERMGKRKLSYEVHGQEEGFYCLFQFKSSGEAVHELERQFRFSDQVIKFQTLKILPLRVLKVKKPKVKNPLAAPAPAAPAHA